MKESFFWSQPYVLAIHVKQIRSKAASNVYQGSQPY
jgi:hypothetical protein